MSSPISPPNEDIDEKNVHTPLRAKIRSLHWDANLPHHEITQLYGVGQKAISEIISDPTSRRRSYHQQPIEQGTKRKQVTPKTLKEVANPSHSTTPQDTISRKPPTNKPSRPPPMPPSISNMNPATHPKTITLSDLKAKSQSYGADENLKSEPLSSLDKFRYETLPSNLDSQRFDQAALDKKNRALPPDLPGRSIFHPYLSKSEVTKLMEWKLKHGTFRPRLLALVSSNSDEEVESVTMKAFEIYSQPPTKEKGSRNKAIGDSNSDDDDDGNANQRIDRFIQALTHLTTLKGVGPATASLILSCWDPRKVPFFSDEVFRWLHFEELALTEEPETEPPPKKKRKTSEPEPKKSKGKTGTKGAASAGGWGRKITYSMKEYRSLLEQWEALRRRMEGGEGEGEEEDQVVEAWEVEKAAYVLFREEN